MKLSKPDIVSVRLDSVDRGRWAVLCGELLIRCRTKSEARRYQRVGQSPGNPYRCVVRRWKRG